MTVIAAYSSVEDYGISAFRDLFGISKGKGCSLQFSYTVRGPTVGQGRRPSSVLAFSLQGKSSIQAYAWRLFSYPGLHAEAPVTDGKLDSLMFHFLKVF